MSIGFIYDGAATYATPDKTMTRSSSPKVLLASFGDGYEQRQADGINLVKETYSLSFINREKVFIDDVVAYLNNLKGTTKFIITIPDTNNTTRTGERDVKVVCVDYNTTFSYDDFYGLTISLRRVFEA